MCIGEVEITENGKLRKLPAYSFIFILLALGWNQLAYNGTRLITSSMLHHNVETAVDAAVPFLPWTVTIYLACYVFWLANYFLPWKISDEHASRYYTADFLAKLVCIIVFIAFPSTNVRPEVTGTGFFDGVMRWLYSIDVADNLFPSIHCIVSWLCYIGVRGRREIPLSYRIFSCVFAVLVFISTLTTKQHAFVDVVGGVALAEICWQLTNLTGAWKIYLRVLERVKNKLSKNKEIR